MPQETSTSPNEVVSLSPGSIEKLFRVFSRRWSHKWEKTFVDKSARHVWEVDLNGLGVDDAMLDFGLHACARLEWPPSPSEFAALCRPDDDLPTANVALQAACQGQYPHIVVHETAQRVGAWNLRHWSDTQARREFMPEYEKACAEWRQGARFAWPQVAGLIGQTQKPPAGISDAEWNEYLRTLHGKSPAQHMAFAREALGRIPDPPRPAPKPILPLNDDDVREQLRLEAEALAESQCIDRASLGLGSTQP